MRLLPELNRRPYIRLEESVIGMASAFDADEFTASDIGGALKLLKVLSTSMKVIEGWSLGGRQGDARPGRGHGEQRRRR